MTSMRTGITTGACAAAAARAATCLLTGRDAPRSVYVRTPAGPKIDVPIRWSQYRDPVALAAVQKDAGDDPDVTDGLDIIAQVGFCDSGDVTFLAGEGVGTVTQPGLQLSPGEPAINPVPRAMITDAIRQETDRPVSVTISIPGGQAIAENTFNPKLGIVGGLSVLGTTGIVRPYCRKAVGDSIACALDVARACGVTAPVLVPGNIGFSGAERHFQLADQQIIEVGNEWGVALNLLAQRDFSELVAVGHPGKLGKLIGGHWYTHSSSSPSAAEEISRLAKERLGLPLPHCETAEGLFASLDAADCMALGKQVAEEIRTAISQRLGHNITPSVFLINMAGDGIGCAGDLHSWERQYEN
jgi:cobalt-precorrin-5B (C1)-methyltransferase